MRIYLDCLKAGSTSRFNIVIPFSRQKDSPGYPVTTHMVGDQFTALSLCEISTTQVFFPAGVLWDPNGEHGPWVLLHLFVLVPCSYDLAVENFIACVR
jgi:hypothetical protein